MKNNKYLVILGMAVLIIVATVVAYFCIVNDYRMGDPSENYDNSLLILKGILTAGATTSISISSAIIWKNDK